jgi:hypothetical protein
MKNAPITDAIAGITDAVSRCERVETIVLSIESAKASAFISRPISDDGPRPAEMLAG